MSRNDSNRNSLSVAQSLDINCMDTTSAVLRHDFQPPITNSSSLNPTEPSSLALPDLNVLDLDTVADRDIVADAEHSELASVLERLQAMQSQLNRIEDKLNVIHAENKQQRHSPGDSKVSAHIQTRRRESKVLADYVGNEGSDTWTADPVNPLTLNSDSALRCKPCWFVSDQKDNISVDAQSVAKRTSTKTNKVNKVLIF